MSAMKFRRFAFVTGVAALLLSGCSNAQIASTFGNWCKHADNCTDNSRTRP